MTKTFNSWETEAEDSLLLDGTVQDIMEVDPRVETNHSIGQLPVPPNPPPPVGWAYWKNQRVPSKAAELAAAMLRNPQKYPMGAFVRIMSLDRLVGLRVEWHNVQGATGKRGCFRGVNLMYKVEESPLEVA